MVHEDHRRLALPLSEPLGQPRLAGGTDLAAILARDDEARARGLTLLPGVGFDVVPSDLLARRLADRLPGARHLELAIQATGGISRGTARSVLAAAGHGLERRQGALAPIAVGARQLQADFGRGPRRCASVPTGDLVTAWHSTRIPNITTYMRAPPRLGLALRLIDRLAPLMRRRPLAAMIDRGLGRLPEGPDAAALAQGRASVWGRVTHADGRSASDTIHVEHPYLFTARAAVHYVRLAAAGQLPPGAITPSAAGQPPEGL
jgi:short subunit dehydrogenase-like uncharacterized protein